MNYQLLKQTNENLNIIINEHMKPGAEKIEYLAEIVALQKKIEQDIALASQDYRAMLVKMGKKYNLNISFSAHNCIMTVIYQTKSDFKPSFYIKIDAKSGLGDVFQKIINQYHYILKKFSSNLSAGNDLSLYHEKTNTFCFLSSINDEYLDFAKHLYLLINELADLFV